MATKVIKGDFGQNLPGSKGQVISSNSRSSMSESSSVASPIPKTSDSKNKWIFTQYELENSPSTQDGIPPDKQLQYRQQAANLIQDMGQKLPVNQLTINTAIVYMHRFYMFRSFKQFSRYVMAPTSLFLAAKVEEQPRKLEHVIKVCHACLHQEKPNVDVTSESYLKKAAEVVQNELVLLETLGFEISIDHPHTYVVKCTQLVKASRELSQMAYFMATNSLHLTTFCLLYKPAIVSAMCIHLSCKWSNYEIPLSSDGKPYWSYIDSTITEPLLEQIITDFLQILKRYPSRLCKLRNFKPSQSAKGGMTPTTASPKYPPTKQPHPKDTQQSGSSSRQPDQKHDPQPVSELKKTGMSLAEYKQREKVKPGQTSVPSKSGDKPLKQESSGWPVVQGNSRTMHPSSHNKLDTGQAAHGSHNKNVKADATNLMSSLDTSEKALESKIAVHMSQSTTKPIPSAKPNSAVKPLPGSKPVSGSKPVLGSKQNPQAQHKNNQSSNGNPQKHKDHHARHSLPANITQTSSSESKPSHASTDQHSIKQWYELGKRHPEYVLKKLKDKSQKVKLTPEELQVYVKIKKRLEEDKRKREKKEQHEKKKKAQQHQHSLHNMSVDSATTHSSSSGNLTMRLKLPPAVQAEISHSNTHGHSSTTTSGSGSEVSPSHKSRKRAHGSDSSLQTEATLPKQSRRSSDGHHKSSEHRHKHKQSRSSKHHHHSKSNTPITEELFQKALADAKVKLNNQGGSGRPTATLKGTSNGQLEEVHKNSKLLEHSRLNFDPSVPVSATLPKDLFEEDCGNNNNSQLSSPETGEIRDDEDDWPQSYTDTTNNNQPSSYASSNSVTKQQDRVPPLTIKSSQIQR